MGDAADWLLWPIWKGKSRVLNHKPERETMEHEPTERRTEARFPIEAKVIIRKNSGETISAIAANISGGGMLLHVERLSSLSVGEAVAVEVELPDHADKPFE